MKRVATGFFLLIVVGLSFQAKSANSQTPAPATPPSSPPTKTKYFKRTTSVLPDRYIVVLNDDVAPDYLSREVRLERVTAIARRHAQAYKGKFDYVYETALKGYAIVLPTEAAAIAISELPEVQFVEQDYTLAPMVGVYIPLEGKCGMALGLQTARSFLNRGP